MVVDKERPYVSPIADVIASEVLESRLFKLIKHTYGEKGVRRGVKEVCKSLRKKLKGIVILAADVSPVDTYSHIPIICEKNNIPYIFVKSRVELGIYSQTQRPTSAVFLIEPKRESPLFKYFSKIEEILKKRE